MKGLGLGSFTKVSYWDGRAQGFWQFGVFGLGLWGQWVYGVCVCARAGVCVCVGFFSLFAALGLLLRALRFRV